MVVETEGQYVKIKQSNMREMIRVNWHLGFTSYGGPAVNFQLFHRLFVQTHHWIDEPMYQELFALCQALPGPGSTKLLYSINIVHCGLPMGLLSFLFWSLPGAIASYGLALGVAQINGKLPPPVQALITGLNAATVGVVAHAAVYLSKKAITDKLTRMLVVLGATAGLLHNALWYFPVLMVAGGVATLLWDSGFKRGVVEMLTRARILKSVDVEAQTMPTIAGNGSPGNSQELEQAGREDKLSQDTSSQCDTVCRSPENALDNRFMVQTENAKFNVPAKTEIEVISWKCGVVIIFAFFMTFTTIMVSRTVLRNCPRSLDLLANLYLAGTITFGGGPVVIPLLGEYTVTPGWVSSRNFLLGLAIFQALPGPNFNCRFLGATMCRDSPADWARVVAVYLGALAAGGSLDLNAAVGAVIGYIAMFSPGIILQTGVMGPWKKLRTYEWINSCVRGVNAAAVGLVYTAVYRLWKMQSYDGHLDETRFGKESWWVVVIAAAFAGGMWFKLPAPAAIFIGGLMGLIWHGVVES